jgi:hypothetical protein
MRLKVHKHEIFCFTFLQKPNPYGPKGLFYKIFENRIRFGRDLRLFNISAYAQSAMKSFPRMLSEHLNHFLVCSGSDKSFPRMLSIDVHVKTHACVPLKSLSECSA